MPSSTIVRADEVNTHFGEWLGAAEGGVFLMRQEQTSGAVLRFDTIEQASEMIGENADEGRYQGPFTGDECLSEVSRFIEPQAGQIRFTTWLDSAAEMAPFDIEFFEGLSGRLQLVQLVSSVQRIRGACTVITHFHLTRESASLAWQGEVKLSVQRHDETVFEASPAPFEFEVGDWDKHYFQTIVFRPEIGACAVVLNLGENVLDRLVLEVVEGVRSVEALADDEVGTDEIDEESVGTIMEENEE
jgi:hypothetical protein